MSDRPPPRDAGGWAEHVEHIGVGDRVRRLTGPLQGFGKMWQKTYRIRLEGSELTPEQVIAEWKQHYGDFWPEHTSFYGPVTGIEPGEIAAIGSKQGPMQLSTGILVLYADDVSFAYMTPEGHPFAGWITFSAYRDEDAVTVAGVDMIIRPSDPIYELGFTFGGSRVEDRMWQHTLRSLGRHVGVTAEPETAVVCVDRRRQWRRFGQVRHNAMLRTTLSRPFRRRPLR